MFPVNNLARKGLKTSIIGGELPYKDTVSPINQCKTVRRVGVISAEGGVAHFTRLCKYCSWLIDII